MAVYPDRAELLREFPGLDEQDIRQALEYAAANLADEEIPLSTGEEQT
jgi:uncharacterized protein (DUF433 family)